MNLTQSTALHAVGQSSSAGLQPAPLNGGAHSEGESCIANISPRERQRRLRFGLIQFVIALAILAVLMGLGVDHLWRLPLFLFFAGATTGFFQWRDKTCVAHARLGTRKLTENMEKIEDEAELAQVRRQARLVVIKAILLAIPLTLIAFILP
jgi:hypothetical protein